MEVSLNLLVGDKEQKHYSDQVREIRTEEHFLLFLLEDGSQNRFALSRVVSYHIHKANQPQPTETQQP